jgi:hypothetical protein
MSLFGPEFGEILKRSAGQPRPKPESGAEREARHRRFDQLIQATAHAQAQSEAVIAMRTKLEESLGERLPKEIEIEAPDFLLAPKTERVYLRVINDFKRYCTLESLPVLPAAPESVAAFLLGEYAHKPYMAHTAFHALAYWHRLNNLPVPNSVLLRSVRKWIAEGKKPPPRAYRADDDDEDLA